MIAYDWERVLLWFFPRRCVWCAGVTEPLHALCPDCEPKAQVHAIAPGQRLPQTALPLVSCYSYHSAGKQIMKAMKFSDNAGYAPSIGFTMAEALREAELADDRWVLCSVPMTAAKVKERGYNQAALLAEFAAKWLNMHFDNGLLCKIHETETQHKLPAEQREQNVADAFEAARPEGIAGRHIVLCDDICTTGATLRACVRALESAGAAEILCLTFLQTKLE